MQTLAKNANATFALLLYASVDFAQHVKNKKNTQIHAKNTLKEAIVHCKDIARKSQKNQKFCQKNETKHVKIKRLIS